MPIQFHIFVFNTALWATVAVDYALEGNWMSALLSANSVVLSVLLVISIWETR